MRTVIRVCCSLALFALLLAAGCKPSMSGQKARYLQNKDALEALGTKKPEMKADITAKLAEFDGEMKAAEAKGGEDGAKMMASLNERMEAYQTSLDPQPAAVGSPPPPPSTPGAKLGPGAEVPPPPTGGAPPAAAQPAGPAGGESGFGGGQQPPQPADQGSGFGGSGGAGGAAPTPPPPQPAGQGGGFGGQ